MITAVSERVLRVKEPLLGDLIEEWTALADQCSDIMGRYPNGEFGPDVFCKTLIADNDGQWRQAPAPETFVPSLSMCLARLFVLHAWEIATATGTALNVEVPRERFSRTISTIMDMVNQASPDWLHSPPLEALPGEILAAKDAFVLASLNRKFFVTRRGYMGIGPKDMWLDDEVHVLSGTSVPFVMRKVTGGADASTVDLVAEDGLALYRMIGECYVHGIMQGEATRKEDAEWENICVC